ncbi:uncharacterized protein At4g15970-like [Malania oleifera]|uniref:uncharacterized protein At4g15970-like n=1 Tax=Malania oleifera TaxID=397392 RepID=UPI0025AE86C2|nr:uncharacterized protein At4g15970-like [Malania oleifera]
MQKHKYEHRAMEAGGKAKLLVILLTTTLAALVLLYFSCIINPIQGSNRDKPWLLQHTQSEVASRKLSKMLKTAAMQDRMVILTLLNSTWAAPGCVLDLFLESFQIGQGTKRLLNHLLILTTDDQAFQHCSSKHLFCFDLSPLNLKPKLRRTLFLTHILKLGYNFVYSDLDVMWLRTPIPHFDAGRELSMASDVYTGHPLSSRNRANGGLFYVRSNEISIQFFTYWDLAAGILHPHHNDISVFEMIKGDRSSKIIEARIQYVDAAYFISLCLPNANFSMVHTVHGGCCGSTEEKVHDLRLVLDDWRNFTAHGSLSSWRAPSKCK